MKRILILVYPFMLSWYPVFALRNQNINYVDLAAILRTLLIVTAGVGVVSLITGVVLRNLEQQSAITGMLAIIGLSYGHLYIQLETQLGTPVHHRYLAGAYLLIFLVVTTLVIRKNRFASNFSLFLAVTSITLTLMAAFETARHDIQVHRLADTVAQSGSPTNRSMNEDQQPDFYLIILDAYTRTDVLKKRYGYDNQAFIQQLREMGFYVPACSQSNYASTKFSLVSATYGDYIQNIVKEGEILPPLQASPLNQLLKSLGYKTIAFENRASGHFDLNEDLHLARNQMALGRLDLRGGINEFERMMIDTSLMRFILDTEIIPGLDDTQLTEWEHWEHYYQTHFILSELTNLPEMPGPKFVFAHIMVPHAPYIFTRDGSFLHTTNSLNGYRSNVEFLDNRLPSVLKTIINKSEPAPIIIIMGDHGPSTSKHVTREMRMATLNGYFVNERAKEKMYDTLTPVNAMRIILNAHYQGAYELLEDTSYYAYRPDQLDGAELIQNNCQALH